MPIITFSYTKDVSNFVLPLIKSNEPIEISIYVGKAPRLRHWRLINFNWESIERSYGGVNTANFADDAGPGIVDIAPQLPTSCMLYPDFLTEQNASKNVDSINSSTELRSVTQYQASPLFIRKNGGLKKYNYGGTKTRDYYRVADESSFRPVNIGFVDVNRSVLSIRFFGQSFWGNNVSTSSDTITKFDAVFQYD